MHSSAYGTNWMAAHQVRLGINYPIDLYNQVPASRQCVLIFLKLNHQNGRL